jgi:hypothetical protein
MSWRTYYFVPSGGYNSTMPGASVRAGPPRLEPFDEEKMVCRAQQTVNSAVNC